MEDTRGTPAMYYKSLNRYFNVFGVDRQLFYLFVGLSLPIAFSARLTPMMVGVSGVVFIILYCAGVLVTRMDNQILSIFRRHIHFQKYYSAHPGSQSKVLLLKPSVPFYEGQRGLV